MKNKIIILTLSFLQVCPLEIGRLYQDIDFSLNWFFPSIVFRSVRTAWKYKRYKKQTREVKDEPFKIEKKAMTMPMVTALASLLNLNCFS